MGGQNPIHAQDRGTDDPRTESLRVGAPACDRPNAWRIVSLAGAYGGWEFEDPTGSTRHVHATVSQPQEVRMSGSEAAGVAMMKPANLGEGDHIAHLGRVHRPRIRAIVVQRLVCSR